MKNVIVLYILRQLETFDCKYCRRLNRPLSLPKHTVRPWLELKNLNPPAWKKASIMAAK